MVTYDRARSSVLTQMMNSMYLLSAFGEQKPLSCSFDRKSIVLSQSCSMRASLRTDSIFL